MMDEPNNQQDDRYDNYVESTRYEGWQDNYNTLMLRLDPRPTLMQIKYMLMNYRYNVEEDKWIENPDLKPRMTKEGVDKLMLELHARMSIDKVLSKLREQRINIYVEQVGEVVLSFIWYNADKYEIDEGEYESISFIVIHNIDIFLRRALDGTENSLLNKSMQFKEVKTQGYNEQKPQQQQSSLNFFSGRK